MDHKGSTRRLFLQSAGVASTVIIAGCSGDSSNGDDSSDVSNDDENPSDSSVDSTNDGSADEEDSVFNSYSIDGTNIVVELTEDGLNRVAQIRLETPTGEKTTEVAETITEYSIDVLRDRAGTWFIDALDESGEPIETVELETTFDVSIDEIGTLSQLGITGESRDFEELSFQLTITNNGDVPIEPSKIEIFAPNFGDGSKTGVIQQDGLVDRDGEQIITTGSDNTYRYESGFNWDYFLVIFPRNVEEMAGNSLQGEILVEYQAEREKTVVPITIEIGEEIIEDSSNTTIDIIYGSELHKR